MQRPAPGLGPLTRVEIIHVNASDGAAQLPRRRRRSVSSASSTANRYQDDEGSSQRAHSMEMMVVTDKRMTDYHGSDIINYVLTLMSIVSSPGLVYGVDEAHCGAGSLSCLIASCCVFSQVAMVYKDATIGNPMTVAVVKLVVLTSDDPDFVPDSRRRSGGRGTSAAEMLRRFCQWQKEHYHQDHDTALLLTR